MQVCKVFNQLPRGYTVFAHIFSADFPEKKLLKGLEISALCIKLKKKRNFEQANEEWKNLGENKENTENEN